MNHYQIQTIVSKNNKLSNDQIKKCGKRINVYLVLGKQTKKVQISYATVSSAREWDERTTMLQ